MMKKYLLSRWKIAALSCLLLGAVSGAQAADPATGKALSTKCVRCHGEHGLIDNSKLPNLAGQNEDYLIIQLRNYRSGFRRSAVMREIAMELDDDDIDNLAAYFSQLK